MTAPYAIPPAVAEVATQGAWASVAVVLVLALVVVGGALGAVRLVTRVFDRIRAPAERLTTYECGEAPVGTAWFRFNNRFTTVALTFLIFDVEMALLWPILPRCLQWLGQGNGWLVFGEVAVFTGTLALGLLWVANQGGFHWDRTVEAVSHDPVVDRGGSHD
jgi:NADH-quinone oxidoreductase subunit A